MIQNQYDGVLQFKGKWRNYQQRILHMAEKHLVDRKIHIVAAPGSGKTTLGIELIRRLGAPCLILSPSITIRQQWLERIVDGFLIEGNNPVDFLSNNLKKMKPITAITYQALYSAMRNGHDKLGEDENDQDSFEEGISEAEDIDFRDFHILDEIKVAGIKTICLDEAHHLRSEWWKALEEFMKELNDITVISLTATPPYDSTPNQWKRYIDLCGPIDEEIFTPELVQEGSLCPHEDYIYFNWPTKDELKEIYVHQQNVDCLKERLLTDNALTSMIASHKGLQHPEEYSDFFLNNPQYFSSLLIFCQEQNIPFSTYLKKLIGTKGKLPKLNDSWLEILLQGFLYDDMDSYQISVQQRDQLLNELKEAGCIHKKRVILTQNEALQKLLVKSQGKIESIGKIVEAEYQSLGDNLRLLILCDYIKKDMLSLVGTEQEVKAEIGAVPIFEYLRRQKHEGIRLGCLSGTVILLPIETKETLEGLLKEYGCEGTFFPILNTEYALFQAKGKNTHIVSAITELFRQGKINTLIGTKSLLGEGWDAPCINTLILATYVGSFMLSNQMRGRTIRVDRDHPEKTGNIWHLACILPQKSGKTKEADLSSDYEMLSRRFDAFLGVSWKENLIESGIERLGIPKFDSHKKMEEINQMMLARAKDRKQLCQRWHNALKVIHDEMEIEQVEAVRKEEIETGYLFINALGMEILSVILVTLLVVGRLLLASNMMGIISFIWGVGTMMAIFFVGKYGVKLFCFSTPERRMKQIAQAVTDALIEIKEIENTTHCKVEVASVEGVLIGTWLKGGNTRDKTTFACCMKEIWGIIDNPRYLLVRRKKYGCTHEYYSVPEIFGKQKERAIIFEKHMRRVLGNYKIIYTRTPEGRKLLLRARTRSFVNKNQRILLGKKVVKGKYE